MRSCFPPLPATLLAFACVSAATLPTPLVAEDRFPEVRAILAEACFACHGPDQQEGGLRLDQREQALQQLDSGASAIVPGNLEASELIRRVTSNDSDERMPPDGEAMPGNDVDTLKQWILDNAPYTQHWAYRAVDGGPLPPVKDRDWVNNPIDRFVLARLESAGIRPSSRADRATLIKRLYYDLIGLPPTADQVDRFLNDPAQDAYPRMVDELLASQHFGERWGRHWLDKARYADSDGYEKDRPRRNAWRYRDWVIDAINHDMPIDQFTIEQLAGDLLPGASERQKLATAFHRQTLTNTEGGVDQEQFRVDAVFDRTETTGTVWLGLTIGCARCHNHKYDAISQDEYYRLFAFFNNGDEANLRLPVSAEATAKYRNKKAKHDRSIRELQDQIDAAAKGADDALKQWIQTLGGRLSAARPIQFHDLSVNALSASASGVVLTRQDDGSYLVSGENPVGPVDYELTATGNLERPISGVQLETLTHESLPKRGPGRADNGNFVLSEIQLQLAGESFEFSQASSSFSQNEFDVSRAIDGKLDSGWAVSPKMGSNQHARFLFAEPKAIPNGSAIKIHLSQHHGGSHSLGRFRLRWITGTDLDQIAPEQIRHLVSIEKRSPDQQQQLADYFLRSEFVGTVGLYQQLDELKKQVPGEPVMNVRVIVARGKPRETKVFDRGDFLSPKHGVDAGGIGVLPDIVGRGDPLDRLDLARWLVGQDNPLTPRVLANHVWSHLFGEGLVRTVNDFGVRGQPPTHPRLLDWLAAEYGRLGWSRKELIKTIVTSATYQQASVHRNELIDIDPQNLLLARQNRFRVPAEIVRDLCLSVSGLLSTRVGGPSVFPPLPADVAALSYANNFKWNTSKGADRYRRGMYTFFKRTSPHPNLIAFDCPDSNTTSPSRRISNTPLQALTVLNNEVYVESAQALAARVIAAPDLNDRQRVISLLRRCIARVPNDDEVQRFQDLLEDSRAWYAQNADEAEKLASRHQDSDRNPVEAAAWISVARIALNLDEFITRE